MIKREHELLLLSFHSETQTDFASALGVGACQRRFVIKNSFSCGFPRQKSLVDVSTCYQ
jgi:hypothetical protein